MTLQKRVPSTTTKSQQKESNPAMKKRKISQIEPVSSSPQKHPKKKKKSEKGEKNDQEEK